MCGGVKRVSRPIDSCHAKSQAAALDASVMADPINQILQGIETASAEVYASGRLCTGSATASVCACNISRMSSHLIHLLCRQTFTMNCGLSWLCTPDDKCAQQTHQ